MRRLIIILAGLLILLPYISFANTSFSIQKQARVEINKNVYDAVVYVINESPIDTGFTHVILLQAAKRLNNDRKYHWFVGIIGQDSNGQYYSSHASKAADIDGFNLPLYFEDIPVLNNVFRYDDKLNWSIKDDAIFNSLKKELKALEIDISRMNWDQAAEFNTFEEVIRSYKNDAPSNKKAWSELSDIAEKVRVAMQTKLESNSGHEVAQTSSAESKVQDQQERPDDSADILTYIDNTLEQFIQQKIEPIIAEQRQYQEEYQKQFQNEANLLDQKILQSWKSSWLNKFGIFFMAAVIFLLFLSCFVIFYLLHQKRRIKDDIERSVNKNYTAFQKQNNANINLASNLNEMARGINNINKIIQPILYGSFHEGSEINAITFKENVEDLNRVINEGDTFFNDALKNSLIDLRKNLGLSEEVVKFSFFDFDKNNNIIQAYRDHLLEQHRAIENFNKQLCNELKHYQDSYDKIAFIERDAGDLLSQLLNRELTVKYFLDQLIQLCSSHSDKLPQTSALIRRLSDYIANLEAKLRDESEQRKQMEEELNQQIENLKLYQSVTMAVIAYKSMLDMNYIYLSLDPRKDNKEIKGLYEEFKNLGREENNFGRMLYELQALLKNYDVINSGIFKACHLDELVTYLNNLTSRYFFVDSDSGKQYSKKETQRRMKHEWANDLWKVFSAYCHLEAYWPESDPKLINGLRNARDVLNITMMKYGIEPHDIRLPSLISKYNSDSRFENPRVLSRGSSIEKDMYFRKKIIRTLEENNMEKIYCSVYFWGYDIKNEENSEIIKSVESKLYVYDKSQGWS